MTDQDVSNINAETAPSVLSTALLIEYWEDQLAGERLPEEMRSVIFSTLHRLEELRRRELIVEDLVKISTDKTVPNFLI